ncbi:MAG: hypothetical protein EXS36_10320 [Pedosphaera sp.]|nr:hypothetical protein [Pedosphaera sp.]
MNPGSQRLRTEEGQQHIHEAQQKSGAVEFATPEEAIRTDLARTIVPPTVRERLAASMAIEPTKPVSWWRSLFR